MTPWVAVPLLVFHLTGSATAIGWTWGLELFPYAVVSLIAGQTPSMPKLSGACYNAVAPGYAFSQSGTYQPRDDQFAEIEGATSPLDAPRELRAREADNAQAWFKTITGDAFG